MGQGATFSAIAAPQPYSRFESAPYGRHAGGPQTEIPREKLAKKRKMVYNGHLNGCSYSSAARPVLRQARQAKIDRLFIYPLHYAPLGFSENNVSTAHDE
jgi:hypothetical protein